MKFSSRGGNKFSVNATCRPERPNSSKLACSFRIVGGSINIRERDVRWAIERRGVGGVGLLQVNRRYTILQLHLDLSHEPEVVGRGFRQVEGTRRSSFCLESRSRFHLKTLELDPSGAHVRPRLVRHSTHVKPHVKSENPCLPPRNLSAGFIVLATPNSTRFDSISSFSFVFPRSFRLLVRRSKVSSVRLSRFIIVPL